MGLDFRLCHLTPLTFHIFTFHGVFHDRTTNPLYDVHVRAGAQMVKGGGDFWFPLSYADAAEEHANTRENVGMQDLSTMGEVDIKGPGAERLVHPNPVQNPRL